MKEKNRFSQLLEHLMAATALKNSTLAKAVQYDVSYISKWVSGKLLPTEKNAEKVFREISRCVVTSMDDESRTTLYREYQVKSDDELERAIYDNLEVEFSYVKEVKQSTGADVTEKTSHFPELTIAQFITKMRHPALRRVNELEVISVVDILALDHDYQLLIAEMENRRNVAGLNYPGVHFSMVINVEDNPRYNTYNAVFLMNLLTNLSNVNFQLYGSQQAIGKIVFAVNNAYSISGMLVDSSHCMAVTTSEELSVCNAIYGKISTFCNKEMLLVRKTKVCEMLQNYDYIQSLFSPNLQWILGHMTEHFLPDDLHEELLAGYSQRDADADLDMMRKVHKLTQNVLEESAVQVLFHENAFTDFAVSGELDFYNEKITLTPEQRLRYMRHILTSLKKNSDLVMKLIHGGLITDFQHIPNPTLFLSDSVCYLRLVKKGPVNNISILNKVTICDIFRSFFNDIWTDGKYASVENGNSVEKTLFHVMRSVEMLSRLEN